MRQQKQTDTLFYMVTRDVTLRSSFMKLVESRVKCELGCAIGFCISRKIMTPRIVATSSSCEAFKFQKQLTYQKDNF